MDARVALIARIGDDDFDRMGLALWRAEGIAIDDVERATGESSGVAQILVYDDGDNSIAVHPGAGSGLNAQHLLAQGTGAVLVTLGSAGCVPINLPGRHLTMVDTIGAGDTFTGSLAASLARGVPLVRAMQWAHAAAALSVTRQGAVAGFPLFAEVTALLPEAAH